MPLSGHAVQDAVQFDSIHPFVTQTYFLAHLLDVLVLPNRESQPYKTGLLCGGDILYRCLYL